MRGRRAWAAWCGTVALLSGCVSETKVVPPDTVPPNMIKPAKVDSNRTPQPATVAAAGTMYFDQGMAAKDPASRQKYFDRASQAFQQALAQDSRQPQALLGLARLYEQRDNRPLACQQYDQLVTLYPQDAAVHNEYGWCLARNKQWPQAIAFFTRATELEPKNNTFARDLGYTLARAERFEESIAVLSRQMSAGQACYRIALMAKHLKHDDICKQYLQRALQNEPEMPEAKRLLLEIEKGSASVQITTDNGTEMPAVAPSTPIPPQQ